MMERGQYEDEPDKTSAAAEHEQRPHAPQLAQALAGKLGAGGVVAGDTAHQTRSKAY